MTLKFYYDLMSQPSRALRILLAATKIPYQDCPVALRKGRKYLFDIQEFLLLVIHMLLLTHNSKFYSGEHKQEPFLSINRFGRVPVIDDDGFKLTERLIIFAFGLLL